jgi:hypothetical protein
LMVEHDIAEDLPPEEVDEDEDEDDVVEIL